MRAFEAAARHGSYSAAARDLNVTHAAIAQHVRRLEDHFGLPLMGRAGNSMRPTDAGRDLADVLNDGFGRIAGAARDLALRDQARPLRLALTPSFAGNWLMPRIGGFWAAHPGIELEIVPSSRLVDLRRDGFDLAVRYGRGPWPGVEAERLVSAGHAVVASPRLVDPANIASLADLADQHWLMEADRTEDSLWAAQNGLDLDRIRLTTFPTNAMVTQAVRAGHGVGIMPAALVDHEVRAGTLAVLCEEVDSPLAYHLLTRSGRVSAPLRTFIRWLRTQV